MKQNLSLNRSTSHATKISKQAITKAFFSEQTTPLARWHSGFATRFLARRIILKTPWPNCGPFFKGEAGQHVAVKRDVSLKQCIFSPSSFFVEIDKAKLEPGKLFGRVNTNESALAWNLTFTSDAKPLLLLPPELYKTKLPTAKSLVGYPMATYNGHLTVNGENIPIKAKGTFDYFSWTFRSETKWRYSNSLPD